MGTARGGGAGRPAAGCRAGCGAASGVRPGHPATRALAAREQAKATELGVSVRTIQSRRARYVRQGLWGLVDQRAARTWEATGRADARLVAAIREVLDAETHASTGTRSRLIRRVVKQVEATHGPGVVPLPSRNTFYKLSGCSRTTSTCAPGTGTRSGHPNPPATTHHRGWLRDCLS